MKTKFKKLIGAVTITGLVLTGFAATNAQAKANTSDSSFNLKFNGNSTAWAMVMNQLLVHDHLKERVKKYLE
ncbi:hypothetical protein BSG8_42670 [Bacillus subtilis subsp. natto]|uniref:hypothetical protein n=1 Tax=Bacillus subtilis TaxID=1423 RepID=UPI0024906269|nr:hypothetical protein [Bacillus subtilis]BDB95515.1 hypothetical protein BSG8_42670 [Bacillus subtilis subsp. natto]